MDVEKLCINCMQEKPWEKGICPHCHFDSDSYQVMPHHLPCLETILDGRYLLGRALGEGGFGITYVALDLQSGERIAIKELFIAGLMGRAGMNAVVTDASADARKFYGECKDKFIQEAQLMQTLRDKKGVVDIYSFFEENSTAYIVMEYLDGDDLLVYLKNRGGRIPLAEAYQLLRPIMKSLIGMHDAGVFHRDISPDNIRYLSNGSMKIMDLGGAKYNYNPARSTIVLVKHGYAPPEQYTSGYKIGPWMDVYAMSATMYRCVTGKVPKQSVSRTDDDDIEKPSELVPGFPPEVERVILKGLALRTENRYVDMREYYTALKQAVFSLGLAESPGYREQADFSGIYPEAEESYEALLQRLNCTAGSGEILPVAAALALLILMILLTLFLNLGWF